MSCRVALFGGTFDPVHHGHLISARAVAEALNLDRVVLVPSANPPHKDLAGVTDAADRLAMARLAVAGVPGFEVSDCETRRTGPSYTIDTVMEFREQLGERVELFWVIGADSLAELAGWYQVEQLNALCRIVTASRPGWESPSLAGLTRRLGAAGVERIRSGIVETPRIDISATGIRERVRNGQGVRWLVPEVVAGYIEGHGLYR